jgi:hypothetical protein
VDGKEWNSQILANLTNANVPMCIGGNAKILEFKHLQVLEMESSGGPSDGHV